MLSVTYCIVVDDGTNCEDRHIPCLATRDQDAQTGIVHLLRDGRVELDYGPDWTPDSGVWLVHKEAPKR